MDTVSTPTANGGDRRKSGRSIRQPQVFSQEAHSGSAKRKRQDDAAEENVEDVDMDSESASEDDGEPDEEELREQNRRKRAKKSQKPVTKKAKTTGSANRTLAIRSANIPKKNVTKAAKQKARSRESQVEQSGLYADVFGQGNDAETAANLWHNVLVEDHVGGVRDMVNLVLQTIGCDQRIDEHDIDDADNITGRLGDVITEYAATNPEDYPFSGKQKGYHAMREVFTEFFRAIPHTLHTSGLFYAETAIWENIHTWIGVMSGAAYRSFRHTATIADLALTTGLTEVGTIIRNSIATTKQQLDAAAKKKKGNAARIQTLQEEMDADQEKLKMIDAAINDAFDSVFVHRYRDVDEKLRAECAAALGSWILNYRHIFLEGSFLRYLGWVLSDPNSGTRLAVIRQLKKIYSVRNNLSSLRGFSERFRQRIVEMGTKDVDLNVRVEAIELLNQLRSAEYLVPDDIDAVGQLVFDNEPRIRKAVANFFVSNIEDLYASSVEDFDTAEFNELLPNVEDVDDFINPCKTWIKFKCLAQTLGSQTRDTDSSTASRVHSAGIDYLDSRYMVATRAIFASMNELTEWESLAGYLLFDHSSVPKLRDASNLSVQVKNAYKLSAGEDVILLDVLYCAAKLDLEIKPEAGKKITKALRDEQQQKLSTATYNLSVFIPQLHSKFGSEPQAAKSILRLHQLYNADLMDDADEGQRDTDVMLKDVKAQFKASHEQDVLNEISRTLRTALMHEVSRQATEETVEDLWHVLVYESLAGLLNGKNVSGRGTLDRLSSRQLPQILSRLVYLASVRDCCNLVESKMVWPGKRGKSQTNQSVMDVLLELVRRGESDEDSTAEIAEYEDETASCAIQILAVYYRWKVVAVTQAIDVIDKSALSQDALTNLFIHKNEVVEALLSVSATRKPLNTVRVSALLNLLGIQVLFATMRHKRPQKGDLDDEMAANINVLVTPLSSVAVKAILETHEAMEIRLGRRTGKKNVAREIASKKKNALVVEEDEDVERPPEGSDDEDGVEDESDAGDDIEFSQENNAEGKEIRRKAAVLAEKALCEFTAKIVLAVISNVVPKDVKTRLLTNRTKLGKSYTQVLAYLEDKKKGKKAAPKTPPRKVNGKAKSSEVVQDSDDEIDELGDGEEDDEEVLTRQGLADDPVEEADDEEVADVEEDGDDMIGD